MTAPEERERLEVRLEHVREHLAALESYGNGEGSRAGTARAEIAQTEEALAALPEAEPEAKVRKKGGR